VLELLQAAREVGVTRIVYGEFYRDQRIFDIAKQIGIELLHVPLPGVNLPPFHPRSG